MTIFVKCGILFTSTILFPLCKSVKLTISKCTEKIKSISEKCKNTNEELDKKVSLQNKQTKNLLSVYGLFFVFCHFACNRHGNVTTFIWLNLSSLWNCLWTVCFSVYLWTRKYAYVRVDACRIARTLTLTQDISCMSARGKEVNGTISCGFVLSLCGKWCWHERWQHTRGGSVYWHIDKLICLMIENPQSTPHFHFIESTNSLCHRGINV